MAHYQVILAYDGTDFYGFQRQGRTRTVQLEVEAALRRIGWQGTSILSAGRTDSGVHASGQVIAFDLDWSHSTDALMKALNANLPPDAAAMQVRETDPDFHPRYHAVSRTYHYRIYVGQDRNPLWERYAWRVWPQMEFTVLKQTAAVLHGAHDFSAFGSPVRPGGSTMRLVYHAEWHIEDGLFCFMITANAFLYHMVRRLVFAQVIAAQNKTDLKVFTGGVMNAEPQVPGMAPPQGLSLVRVEYPAVQE